jgi:hypothetical protein
VARREWVIDDEKPDQAAKIAAIEDGKASGTVEDILQRWLGKPASRRRM